MHFGRLQISPFVAHAFVSRCFSAFSKTDRAFLAVLSSEEFAASRMFSNGFLKCSEIS